MINDYFLTTGITNWLFNIPKNAFIDISNHNVNVIFIVALAKRFGRGLWDTMMYFLVIRSRGRVPISDGFVARRIAGPGLAANHFFQVMRQFFIIEGDISSFVFCKPTKHSYSYVSQTPKW